MIGTGPQLAPAQSDSEIQRQMYDALLHETRVNVVYEPRSGNSPKEYELSPLGLGSRHCVLYFVGPLWEYDNVAQLALHRLSAAATTNVAAYRPPKFELADYIGDAKEFSYPTGQGKIELVVSMDENASLHLIERPLSPDQTTAVQADQRIHVAASVIDIEEMTWWLLGFGSALEVLGPPAVRARIAKTVQAATVFYD